MIDLNIIQEELFNVIPDAADVIPIDFEFKDSLGIEIKVGNNIADKDYCKEIDLQIRIIGLSDEKMNIQSKAYEVDAIINNYRFKDSYARIVRENVYYTSYYEKDKFNIVLMYIIKKY